MSSLSPPSVSPSPSLSPSPLSSSAPSPASRFSELSTDSSASSVHTSPAKPFSALPSPTTLPTFPSHNILIPNISSINSLSYLSAALRALPVTAYDRTIPSQRRYVLIALDITRGGSREEHAPPAVSLPGFVKYSNGNARIEGDLMSFVERITGEEGEFRRGDWERFGAFIKSVEVSDVGKREPRVEDGMTVHDIEALFKNSEASSLMLTHASALSVFAISSLHLVFCFPSPYHTPSPAGTQRYFYVLTRAPFTFPPQFLPSSQSSLTPLLSDSETLTINNTSLTPHPFSFPTLPSWTRLWAFWDLITLRMIPREMLHHKPIDLRHKCLFYIGHIPTFVDMLIVKEVEGEGRKCGEGKGYTNAGYVNIFERGIDPHVDDPEYCHSHSEVPTNDADWPSLEAVLAYRDRIRARILRIYDEIATGKRTITRRLARVMQMAYEHEGFHVETLLYMLIQRTSPSPDASHPLTVSPPTFPTQPSELLALQHASNPPPSTPYATLGPAVVSFGIDDAESSDLRCAVDNASGKAVGAQLELTTECVQTKVFGWDNENPVRSVAVGQFRAEWRTVTNGEFWTFWKARNKDEKNEDKLPMPGSWVMINGEVHILHLSSPPVPLRLLEHTPVLASYDLLADYAKSRGGRLPTEPELRLFLDTYAAGYEEGAGTGGRAWGCDVATAGLEERNGCGTNGNVWEWTSTVFDTHPGFEGTTIFPGYSSDFYDGVHHVVLGASYATIPRLADRRSLRNFYQHNYPYAWVGGRVVYDLN